MSDQHRRADWRPVACESDLPAAGVRRVTVAGQSLVLVRDGDHVVAVQPNCPHDHADLGHGHVADGRLVCPRHEASFCLATGEVSAGWRLTPLKRYAARLSDGQVEVDAAAVEADPPRKVAQRWDLTRG